MVKSLRVGIVAALVTVLLAPPALAQRSEDTLIVPGLRIGKYPLEASVDDITKLAGSPPSRQHVFRERDAVIPVTGSVGPFTLTSWFLETGTLSAAHRDEYRLEYLFLSSSWATRLRTEQGVGLRSKRADVELAHGRPTWEARFGIDANGLICQPSRSGCRQYTITAYNSIGIAFWFEETGFVWGIFIFRAGDAPSNPF